MVHQQTSDSLRTGAAIVSDFRANIPSNSPNIPPTVVGIYLNSGERLTSGKPCDLTMTRTCSAPCVSTWASLAAKSDMLSSLLPWPSDCAPGPRLYWKDFSTAKTHF